MAEEIELDELFKKVNTPAAGADDVPVGGDKGTGTFADPDGSTIQVKSAKELESAADDGKSADDDDDKGGVASDSTEPNDVATMDDDDYDAEVINTLYQVIAEKTGIQISNTDIKSPDELIEAIEDIISKKSKPSYSSEIAEAFDEFMADGGDPMDFFGGLSDDSSLPRVDTQKDKENVVRLVLKDAGFSDKQIEKKIDTYIENETLAEEADDALDILKRKNAKNVEASIKARKEDDARMVQEQQKLFQSIEQYIDDMKDVRGISITKEQKKEMKDYLFKVDKKDGMTGYQRDYGKNIGNLVESAFFTKNGNALLKAAESKGSSDAISKLKSVLKTNKISGTQQRDRQDAKSDVSAFLRQAAALSGRAA